MGYEITLIIGEIGSFEHEGRQSVHEYARLDLSKPGYDSAICNLTERKGQPVYFYADDGNTRVTENRYGKELTALPIQDVLSALETDRGNDDYRRFQWACALLASIARDAPEAVVIMFGH